MRTNSYSNQNIIEDIILEYSKRGMTILKQHLDQNYCEKAALSVLAAQKSNILITTGFYVEGYAETDGPVGAVFLCRALQKLGFNPVLVTDKYCQDFFENEGGFEIVYVPISHDISDAFFYRLIETYRPVCLISVERCGRTYENDYQNMRGLSIKNHTAPIDRLFVIAAARKIITIGIGDGGNEIGMGNLQDIIRKELTLTPSVIPVDHLIIATVSNWGVYGLIAYLQLFTNTELLPTFEDVQRYLDKIIKVGSIDGVTKQKTLSVDGYNLAVEKDILDKLSQASNLASFNYFTMSEDYASASISQYVVGQKVIDQMMPYILANNSESMEVLDIGCGPGNLTNTIYNCLCDKNIKLTAIDIDDEAIKRARDHFANIAFFTDDLYSLGIKTPTFDFVFSNETLHWMPKLLDHFYKDESIVYYFFPQDLKMSYQNWGNQCFRRAFNNIYKIIKDNGMAFIQFGLDGQLKKVYEVVNNIVHSKLESQASYFKLPLYYPIFDEVINISKECGFEIVETQVIVEPLWESSAAEIVAFLRGFLENNLKMLFGLEKTLEIFLAIAEELSQMDFKELTKDQWHHLILVLRKAPGQGC